MEGDKRQASGRIEFVEVRGRGQRVDGSRGWLAGPKSGWNGTSGRQVGEIGGRGEWKWEMLGRAGVSGGRVSTWAKCS